MIILLDAIRNSNLSSISQPTVRCQFIKKFGSDKEAWRAVRLTLFDGPAVKEKLASILRVSLDS